MTNPILKNKIKYTDIKLAKGIFLDDTQTQTRYDPSVGISSQKFGHKWFLLQKGNAIFKDYSNEYHKELKNIRIANELLCYELAKQVNVPCAEYELATINGITGLVTYDVAKTKTRLLSAANLFELENYADCKNEFEYYLRVRQNLEDRGCQFDKQKMIVDLYKIVLFDTFTIQSDRHRRNIFVLINDSERKIEIAPLIDNEFAFNTINLREEITNNDNITENALEDSTYHIYKLLSISPKGVYYDNDFLRNIEHIVHLAEKNETLRNEFNKFLKNYNIQKAIESVKQKGVEINPKYEEYLYMTEKFVRNKIKTELNCSYNNYDCKYDYDFML